MRKLRPQQWPRAHLLLASLVQGTSSRLPLTSLGTELGPHQPEVLRLRVSGSGGSSLERPVDRFPESTQVPCCEPGSCYRVDD